MGILGDYVPFAVRQFYSNKTMANAQAAMRSLETKISQSEFTRNISIVAGIAFGIIMCIHHYFNQNKEENIKSKSFSFGLGTVGGICLMIAFCCATQVWNFRSLHSDMVTWIKTNP